MLPADAMLDAGMRTEHVCQRSASRRQKSGVHDGLLRKLALKEKARHEAGPFGLYCNAVIIIHSAVSGRVAPVPGIVFAVFRRSLELSLGNAGTIATKVGVVLQRLPGQG
jgi:hypothetical protein